VFYTLDEVTYEGQRLWPSVLRRHNGQPRFPSSAVPRHQWKGLYRTTLAEPFVFQLKSLIGAMQTIQFYTCFISYTTKDQDFADRLHPDLQKNGVRSRQ
jgi:hypothetical protein